MPEQAACDEWVGTGYAGKRLGYSQVTMWRICQAGLVPCIRVGKEFRLPRSLVEAAYAAVMAGTPVNLTEFAREWSARRAAAKKQSGCVKPVPAPASRQAKAVA